MDKNPIGELMQNTMESVKNIDRKSTRLNSSHSV